MTMDPYVYGGGYQKKVIEVPRECISPIPTRYERPRSPRSKVKGRAMDQVSCRSTRAVSDQDAACMPGCRKSTGILGWLIPAFLAAAPRAVASNTPKGPTLVHPSQLRGRNGQSPSRKKVRIPRAQTPVLAIENPSHDLWSMDDMWDVDEEFEQMGSEYGDICNFSDDEDDPLFTPVNDRSVEVELSDCPAVSDWSLRATPIQCTSDDEDEETRREATQKEDLTSILTRLNEMNVSRMVSTIKSEAVNDSSEDSDSESTVHHSENRAILSQTVEIETVESEDDEDSEDAESMNEFVDNNLNMLKDCDEDQKDQLIRSLLQHNYALKHANRRSGSDSRYESASHSISRDISHTDYSRTQRNQRLQSTLTAIRGMTE